MSDEIIVLGQYDPINLDWLLAGPDEGDNGDELANAVVIALGTDRLAKTDDRLPNPDSSDRRGWWADFEADDIWASGLIGSRLWLLERETITGPEARKGSTIAKVEAYVREALQPLKDKRIASALSIQASRIGHEGIVCDVIIFRGPSSAIQLRFAGLWSGIKV